MFTISSAVWLIYETFCLFMISFLLLWIYAIQLLISRNMWSLKIQDCRFFKTDGIASTFWKINFVLMKLCAPHMKFHPTMKLVSQIDFNSGWIENIFNSFHYAVNIKFAKMSALYTITSRFHRHDRWDAKFWKLIVLLATTNSIVAATSFLLHLQAVLLLKIYH